MPASDFAPQARTAARILRMRALRWDYFRSDLFDEHAWSMLLILFVTHSEGRVIASEDLCRESGADGPTGQRWIRHLVKSELLELDGDNVQLTALNRAEMADYLTEIGKLFDEDENEPATMA